MRLLISFAVLMTSITSIYASNGLVIHATEMGVAKFHRIDNIKHPYGENNAWTPYILPKDAGEESPLVVHNADKSVTIFFSTLEEMLKKAVEVSEESGEKIAVLNLHGHGLPGGMWFPANDKLKNSFECAQWVQAASGADEANYDQYYTPVSKNDVMMIRQYAQSGMGGASCVTGLSQWKTVANGVANFKTSLAPNLRFNILSCVVGLGPVGAKFTNGLGGLLTNSDSAQFRSSMYFGLGDWSMPEGMGFWDYQNDSQLEHDNSIYPVNRKDREIMQKGSTRVSALSNGKWDSKVLESQDFLTLDRELDLSSARSGYEIPAVNVPRPTQVRIVGTGVYVPVNQ